MFVADRFVYVHMQKTGGTRIREMLTELTEGRGVGRQHGFFDAKPNKLVFGSIRNPWAWYVSLWAFGCEGRGGLQSRLQPDWQYLYKDVDDPELFREWLRKVYSEEATAQMRNGYGRFSLRGDVGFMSYRYAYLYLPGVDLETAPYFRDYFELENYDREHNMVDAWIKLEDLAYTLYAALKLAGYEVSRERVGQLSERRSNTSGHGDIAGYYDFESAQRVRHRERLIVDKHGYGNHCPV